MHFVCVTAFREGFGMQKPSYTASMKIIANVQKKIDGWKVKITRCDIQCTSMLLGFLSLTPAHELGSVVQYLCI